MSEANTFSQKKGLKFRPTLSPSIMRARKSLGLQGEVLYEYLTKPTQRQLLKEAAEHGLVPVSAVSELLLEELPDVDYKSHSVRQFIGLLTKQILEEEGFEVVVRGVKLPGDPIFSKGSRYCRVQREEQDQPPARQVTSTDDLLTRIVGVLTGEERDRLAQMLSGA